MHLRDYLRMAAEKGYDAPLEKHWAPGHLNDSHTHDEDLFLLILEGGMAGGAKAEPTWCGPGDTIEVPGGTDHIERGGAAGVRFLATVRRSTM
ncbi:hypothetical protein KAJ83_13835 [Marivibrio halodurans]|uniref:Cupin domain-containing protein n=1 Tax=Marivibrio halodurans TaxID=2039722 RepID=A0A8J7S0J5_9PROT|nr:hypothetical protein [Marivibrio halodurans]MBP5858095.1 hypothetical protein [Marivibrio halodurans]